MVSAHVCAIQRAAHYLESYGIAQTLPNDALVFAVGVHGGKRSANRFFFFAGVATAAHRDIQLALVFPGAKGNCASQVPAAIFVVQAVLGIRSQNFRSRRRRFLAWMK